MSWNGTVRCGNCYESGHNRTGCPKLKKAWEEDPTSYEGREWARIVERKAKPKMCGYCDESGHTRAGCDTMKAHKVIFTNDAILWRRALVKWMSENQLRVGALVRCNDASYYHASGYMHPSDENYVPPLGLIMNSMCSSLTHYHGIMNSHEWLSGSSMFSFERIGAGDESLYRRDIGIALPCIPGIVPRYGKGWYGAEPVDRMGRISNVDWEVVSPGQADFSNSTFLSLKFLKQTVKEHFKAPNETTERGFYTFCDFQRTQLQEYLNGETESSEMVDPEVPGSNT